jgi:hypothetical protein
LSPLEWDDKLPQRWELPQNLGELSYRGMVAWQAPERLRLGVQDYRIEGLRELLMALLV